MNTITAEAQRGRLYLVLAFAITLASDIGLTILEIFVPEFQRAGPKPMGAALYFVGMVVRLLITFALFFGVWRGLRWVRWLMVTFIGLALLLTLPILIRSPNLVAIGIVLQFCITLALLAFPPSLSAFINFQRAKYQKGSTP